MPGARYRDITVDGRQRSHPTSRVTVRDFDGAEPEIEIAFTPAITSRAPARAARARLPSTDHRRSRRSWASTSRW